MNAEKKKNILFIKDRHSPFNTESGVMERLFNQVDIVHTHEEALKLFYKNQYEVVLGDLSVKTQELVILKQFKDKKPAQVIFAMLLPKDSDKLYKIADLGINAFELNPDQFDLAMEEIAKFNS